MVISNYLTKYKAYEKIDLFTDDNLIGYALL